MPVFQPFDPLSVTSNHDTAIAAQKAVRRQVENILSSYVGWYDPFSEMTQNALDAIDKRATIEAEAGTLSQFTPTIRIIVDLVENQLTVSDNGVGMTEDEFRKFLAPNFSFKESSESRGHKGVGASYLAYGFNYLRVHTKSPGYEACGRIIGARTWMTSPIGTEAPLVEPDESPDTDAQFSGFDRGTTVTVRFSAATQPKKLGWLGAKDAQTWLTILRLKTSIGQVLAAGDSAASEVRVELACISESGATAAVIESPSYLWLRDHGAKSAPIREVEAGKKAALEKHGDANRIAGKFKDLSFIHDAWEPSELPDLLGKELAAEHADVIQIHQPRIVVEYGYSAKLWTQFNDNLGTRANAQVLRAGIQLAANRMPQGEVIQVPLAKYIGRQNQVHILVHFSDYTPDLGRKGFSKPLVDFATDAGRAILDGPISRLRTSMRKNTGTAPDLQRQLKIEEWKKEMVQHEADAPLDLASDYFFLPTKKISITSEPTREQDVIALFHELLSGGVIRGLEILATNERLTYDGLYRIAFNHPDPAVYSYDEASNPLGLADDVLLDLAGKVSDPRVLEYKYSLDGLIGDLDSQEKNINDVNLCVAWTLGGDYEERYSVTSLLVPENLPQRQSHGVTHVLLDQMSGAHLCDLIILKDLVHRLRDPEGCIEEQRELHE